MDRTIYSAEQIKVLLDNPNVAGCSSKSVAYSKKFKVRAVKKYYEQGLGPDTIFQKAGFDLNVLGKDKPKNCLKLWKKIYKARGEEGLSTEGRGRKDELDFKSCNTFQELSMKVNEYMQYYNHQRYQWGLKKMTPVQYRDHLLVLAENSA